jgi:hypothetical protein
VAKNHSDMRSDGSSYRISYRNLAGLSVRDFLRYEIRYEVHIGPHIGVSRLQCDEDGSFLATCKKFEDYVQKRYAKKD